MKTLWPYLLVLATAYANAQPSPKAQITYTLDFVTGISDSVGAVSAAELAAQQINMNDNNRTRSLSDKFNVHIERLLLSRDISGAGMYTLLRTGHTNPVAYIGPTTSGRTLTMYRFLASHSLLPITPNAFNGEISNTDKYPYQFASAPYDLSLYPATFQLFRYLKWRRIGVLYGKSEFDSTAYLGQVANRFSEISKSEGIEVITMDSILHGFLREREIESSASIQKKLRLIKDNDIRIVVVIMELDPMAHFFCEAYRAGMYGPKYRYYMFFGEIRLDWIHSTSTFHDHIKPNCSNEELYEIQKNIIFPYRRNKGDPDRRTVSGKTVEQVWQLLTEKVEVEKRSSFLRFRENLLFIYDAVWALSLAFSDIVKQHPQFFDGFKPLKSNKSKMAVISESLNKVKFYGTTGPYEYVLDDKNHMRYRKSNGIILKIVQPDETRAVLAGTARYGKEIDIGSVNTDGAVSINQSKLFYPLPLDGPLRFEKIEEMPKAVIAIFFVLVVVGMIISIIFLIVNMYYSNVKFMKLSSPNINSLICIGCMFSFIAVITHALDTGSIPKERIPTNCHLTLLFLMVGFTLTFGSLFSKTWRIYRIFTRSQNMKYVVIKDLHLFSVVLLLLLVDLVIMIIWWFHAAFELNETVLKETHDLSTDSVAFTIAYQCHSSYQDHYFVTIFVYKGLVMIFGLFVAFETRKIKVEAINDSNQIGMAVYNFSFILVVMLIVFYALHDAQELVASYIIFALAICEITSVTLYLVFVPKIIMLSKNYDDPNFRNGRPVLETTRTQSISSRSGASNSTAMKESRTYSNCSTNTGGTSEPVIYTNSFAFNKD